ncbi:hypothetical protein JG688_00017087 [Phytophthora aleatoria]|uniref:Uncharacterized protein n=1 Tax=Phytophthora aleatoria TaxID=2496075 RepID=A0A8J5ID20_9STRA|nr:hypothetical protein JG688_00017087 [Phytophthora aleatoria]
MMHLSILSTLRLVFKDKMESLFLVTAGPTTVVDTKKHSPRPLAAAIGGKKWNLRFATEQVLNGMFKFTKGCRAWEFTAAAEPATKATKAKNEGENAREDGFSVHAIKKEADMEVRAVLNFYVFCFEELAVVSMVTDVKAEKGKFAGDNNTMAI